MTRIRFDKSNFGLVFDRQLTLQTEHWPRHPSPVPQPLAFPFPAARPPPPPRPGTNLSGPPGDRSAAQPPGPGHAARRSPRLDPSRPEPFSPALCNARHKYKWIRSHPSFRSSDHALAFPLRIPVGAAGRLWLAHASGRLAD